MSNKPFEDNAPIDKLGIAISDFELDNAATLLDPSVEDDPSDIDLLLGDHYEDLEKRFGKTYIENFLTRASAYDSVKWPTFDKNAPDYASISEFPNPDNFSLNADTLDRLIALNQFEPYRSKGVIAFALRGAKLETGVDAENVDAARLLNVRPDHINFNCVIGLYFLESRKISLYTGSTVPCRKAVYNHLNGGSPCNLLPNGLYTYYVWRHKSIKPALRLAESNQSNATLENGQFATVLRTKNDTIFGIRDVWDPTQPYDNIHCSYYIGYNPDLGAYFSSWGCLTIRGKKNPSDQWEKFQRQLSKLGPGARIDLILLTGKDAALAAVQIDEGESGSITYLSRLRVGSQGPAVEKLQTKLGIARTGYFGFATRKKLADYQRELTAGAGDGGASADGIYSPSFDSQTGWGVFSSETSAATFLEDMSLRSISPAEFEDSESLPTHSVITGASPPISFVIKPADEPQESGISFQATGPAGQQFFVAKSTKYGSRKGLTRSSTLITYDRQEAAREIGLWAHFIWPTVMGESNGRHITINSYDRAHFTWGFYQLAAHTPKDNLILLMRELLTLENASSYFPDLTLVNGRVHQITPEGNVDLEYEQSVTVGRGTEIQIPRFMRYLNRSSTRIENNEIVNAARLVHWTSNDPEVIRKTILVSLGILKRKARGYAQRYGLYGRRPELAIWICDMFHQGRGSVSQVREALALPTFSEQLNALSRIDVTGQHEGRLRTVKRCVDELIAEQRFSGVRFGEGELSLDDEA